MKINIVKFNCGYCVFVYEYTAAPLWHTSVYLLPGIQVYSILGELCLDVILALAYTTKNIL